MTRNEKEEILKSFETAEQRCVEIRKEMLLNDSEELRKALKHEESELTDILRNIENAIYSLNDIRERRVLWLKYVGKIENGKRNRLKYDWQIANEIGYSSAWVKKARGRALDKIRIEDV